MAVTVHSFLPTRVLLGAGARALVPDEVARLGRERVLLVATRSAAAAAEEAGAALRPRLAAPRGGGGGGGRRGARPAAGRPLRPARRAHTGRRHRRGGAARAAGRGRL